MAEILAKAHRQQEARRIALAAKEAVALEQAIIGERQRAGMVDQGGAAPARQMESADELTARAYAEDRERLNWFSMSESETRDWERLNRFSMSESEIRDKSDIEAMLQIEADCLDAAGQTVTAASLFRFYEQERKRRDFKPTITERTIERWLERWPRKRTKKSDRNIK
jgi:hypothetical protein